MSMASLAYSVKFSKLNSDTTFNPDRSENGKNFARKSKIRPQNTVFCDRDKRLSKSLHMRRSWFLQDAKNNGSFHTSESKESQNWNLMKISLAIDPLINIKTRIKTGDDWNSLTHIVLDVIEKFFRFVQCNGIEDIAQQINRQCWCN